jgi:hypothetical protein
MKSYYLLTALVVRFFAFIGLFGLVSTVPSFNLEAVVAQSSNYQQSTLSVSSTDLKSKVTLFIYGEDNTTNLAVKVYVNGKLVRSVNGTGVAEIVLNNYLRAGKCTVDISGSYAPSFSGVVTELTTATGSSQQQSGGNGRVAQRIVILVR